MFQAYPPAKRDRTIWKFIAVAISIEIVAYLLVAAFHRAGARFAVPLVLIALCILVAGPIVKWWRWSRDPGFQEFLAAKKARMRGQ